MYSALFFINFRMYTLRSYIQFGLNVVRRLLQIIIYIYIYIVTREYYISSVNVNNIA